jgi:hypothetical protein
VEKRKRRRIWRPSILYGFVRSRQLDGTLNEAPRVGTYIITSARVMASWGWVSEARWPPRRRGDPWPPVEPPGLDKIAKYNRSLMHYRIRNLSEMQQCLSKNVPVQLAVPIHSGWYSAVEGKIERPSADLRLTENHSIVAEEFDDNLELIRFWNNWGKSWGDGGYGYLTYEYFEKHFKDAWVKDFRSPRLPEPNLKRLLSRRNALQNSLDHFSIIIDLWDLSADIRIGWCFAMIRDNWFEIEDLFIRPDHKEQPGHIKQLIFQIRESLDVYKCRLRFWIPRRRCPLEGRKLFDSK